MVAREHPAPRENEPPPADSHPMRARRATERAAEQRDAAEAAVRRLVDRQARYENLVIRAEIRRGEQEFARASGEEESRERSDTAADAAFFRAQIVPMLEDGWTLEELAGIGISAELIDSLALRHHLRDTAGE